MLCSLFLPWLYIARVGFDFCSYCVGLPSHTAMPVLSVDKLLPRTEHRWLESTSVSSIIHPMVTQSLGRMEGKSLLYIRTNMGCNAKFH